MRGSYQELPRLNSRSRSEKEKNNYRNNTRKHPRAKNYDFLRLKGSLNAQHNNEK